MLGLIGLFGALFMGAFAAFGAGSDERDEAAPGGTDAQRTGSAGAPESGTATTSLADFLAAGEDDRSTDVATEAAPGADATEGTLFPEADGEGQTLASETALPLPGDAISGGPETDLIVPDIADDSAIPDEITPLFPPPLTDAATGDSTALAASTGDPVATDPEATDPEAGDPEAGDTAPTDPPTATSAPPFDPTDPLAFPVPETPPDAPVVLGGTEAPDNLAGGGGDDVLGGAGGDDMLNGRGGDDFLVGGDGADILTGAAGADVLIGGGGDDRLEGGSEADLALGGEGDDTLAGGEGDDRLSGDDGNDSMLGGTGDDTLLGGAGDDALTGHDGNDLLVGGTGHDTLDGGSGDDTLNGVGLSGLGSHDTDGRDDLNGGAGMDEIALGAFDHATGGADADTFQVGDWIGAGEAGTITDYDHADDQIVVLYDPATHPAPTVTVETGETPGDVVVALDGVRLAHVIGGHGLTPDDIRLVPRGDDLVV